MSTNVTINPGYEIKCKLFNITLQEVNPIKTKKPFPKKQY